MRASEDFESSLGCLQAADSDHAADGLHAIGLQALQPPDREEIRQTVKFFLKGVDENLQWPPTT